MKVVLNISVTVLIVILSLPSVGVGEVSGPEVMAWNDETEPAWDAACGGDLIYEALHMDLKLLEARFGLQVDPYYLKDAECWLRLVLKPEYVPEGMWKHEVAANGGILYLTRPGPLKLFFKGIDPSKYSVGTYVNVPSINTSGIVVRYQTQKYVFQVADDARHIAVHVRPRGHEPAEKMALWQSVLFAQLVLNELFVSSVSRPGGDPAKYRISYIDPESGLMSFRIHHPSAKENQFKYNDYFDLASVTVCPLGVMRVVFGKRMGEGRATAYAPKSRFERITTLNAQSWNCPVENCPLCRLGEEPMKWGIKP